MKITGWHGGLEKIAGVFRASNSSEGTGVYIAEDRELAEFFGHPHQVEATIKRPLIVDHEELPAIEYLLMRGFFNHMRPSPWIQANYHASEKCGLLDFDPYEDRIAYRDRVKGCFSEALTDILIEAGYDAVKIIIFGRRIPEQVQLDPFLREKNLVWWVVFDAKKVKLAKR